MKLLSEVHPLSKSRLSDCLNLSSIGIYFDLPHNMCLKVNKFAGENYFDITLCRYNLKDISFDYLSNRRVSGHNFCSAYKTIRRFHDFPEDVTCRLFVSCINLFLKSCCDEF